MNRFALFACFIALIFAPSAHAQSFTNETDWESLTEDGSREELFSRYIEPARLEAEGNHEFPVVPFALPRQFDFPHDAIHDDVLKVDRGNVVFGIDISHHTGHIDFRTLNLQKSLFVYAKATQGLRFKDGDFGDNWQRLGDLPDNQFVYRGAYHFLTANGSAADQARSYLAYLKLHGGLQPDDLPPCMDLEWDVSSTSTDQWKGHEAEIIAKALEWLQIVENETGRTPVIYTARSWWRDRGLTEGDFSKFDHYPIWMADYSTTHKAVEKPAVINGRTQTMWQFTDNALLSSGYDRGVDASIFYGTAAQFEQALGISR